MKQRYSLDLESEYHGILGTAIPWRRLGYTSILDFVHSMPEAITVRTLSRGHVLLHAVPDPSTRHIASMVRKQMDAKGGYAGMHTHSDLILPSHDVLKSK